MSLAGWRVIKFELVNKTRVDVCDDYENTIMHLQKFGTRHDYQCHLVFECVEHDLTASDLREIADKLDQINGVES
jgi:hypothetical protein